jgi:uncharacterized iron-regulated membrane protein
MSRLHRAMRFTRHWHARCGVLVSIFFLTLATTGVALNHTEALNLSRKPVSAPWLMHWYGVKAESAPPAYPLGQGYFAGNAQHWVMDGKILPVAPEAVVGAVEAGGVRYLASASALYLYQPDGTLIEKLPASALPGTPIGRIGAAEGGVLIAAPRGVYASEDGLDWRPADAQAAVWSQSRPLPVNMQAHVNRLFAPSLPLERILLDLHSGRIFGRYGPLLMDLAALMLMVLSLSGVWIYLRSLKKKH